MLLQLLFQPALRRATGCVSGQNHNGVRHLAEEEDKNRTANEGPRGNANQDLNLKAAIGRNEWGGRRVSPTHRENPAPASAINSVLILGLH